MKIAIINENSQAPKNGIIEAALKKVVEPMGHEVVNYGMYSDASPPPDLCAVRHSGCHPAEQRRRRLRHHRLRYRRGCHAGAEQLSRRDLRPCGRSRGCLHLAQINDGNAVSMPFAKGFGWGGELNLEYTFEKLFGFGFGRLPR